MPLSTTTSKIQLISFATPSVKTDLSMCHSSVGALDITCFDTLASCGIFGVYFGTN